jgi:Putative Ig domain
MAQPVWITPAGSLGTIPEGVFYEVPLQAIDPADIDTIYYEVIAGQLPAGIEVINNTGLIAGVPQAIVVVDGVPAPVSADVTSKFAVRAYTKKTISGVTVINRLADRTFTLTVTGQNNPEFITPAGNVGTYFDGTQIAGLQIQYTDVDPADIVVVRLTAGQLPPGLTISATGLISGFIAPNTSAGVAAGFSRDGQGFSQYPFDFSTKSSTVNYQFILEITDGKTSNLRTFTILVYSRNALTADDTQVTADNTFVTADGSPQRTPILLTPTGSIGTVRNDNFYAFKFDGIDLDGDQFEYTISLGGSIGYDEGLISFQPGSYDFTGEGFDQGGFTLPPGLQLDPNTGWLYGYIPDLGITELTYNFAIRVYKTLDPTVISDYYYYSLNIVGSLSTGVTWLTPSNLGFIENGATSTLYVAAVNKSGIPLQYQLESGSTSQLPQGLQLLPEGDIAGRVSFNTFALDGGTTTFDVRSRNLYNPNSNPTIGIGTETTFDMVFTFTVNAYSINGVVSVFKTFTIRVIRRYNEPYDNLYIQAMPPQNDRAILNSLLQNDDIFPTSLLYRPQDPNFGLATKVVYQHAYGLTAATLDAYVNALKLNHYWKNLVLGSIETAQARDADGNIIYEVVYSRVVDNLVNNSGQSVGKEVTLAYPVDRGNDTNITVVYPNSLVDMRTQVIDTVGQISNVLPRWMLSKQADGSVLGFTPAWVIAYTKPGKSGQIKYNIETIFGNQLNLVDFDVDRYELDNLLTKNWNREQQQWIPTPPEATTFDVVPGPPTVFDGNSVEFIVPVDIYTNTQIYDRYLLFPKYNILDNIPQINAVLWVNDYDEFIQWVNDSAVPVTWTGEIA